MSHNLPKKEIFFEKRKLFITQKTQQFGKHI
jgi:hypothetical protein